MFVDRKGRPRETLINFDGTAEAATKMSQATALYNQQQNLNSLYQQAVHDRDYYKDKASKTDGLTAQVTGLQ